MPRHIKTISDGSIIEYDSGSFDDWCVYLTRDGEPRYAPTDIQYFNELNDLSDIYGRNRIYDDFVRIYTPTTAVINPAILTSITEIAQSYGDHAIDIDIWFTVIYAGMVAEENKARAILKKRIKRLGMYQVLIGRASGHYAANFSRGKKWRELDAIMREAGF